MNLWWVLILVVTVVAVGLFAEWAWDLPWKEGDQ
jgi:hypothetical protein